MGRIFFMTNFPGCHHPGFAAPFDKDQLAAGEPWTGKSD
jgi:hypothetical protein